MFLILAHFRMNVNTDFAVFQNRILIVGNKKRLTFANR